MIKIIIENYVMMFKTQNSNSLNKLMKKKYLDNLLIFIQKYNY